MARRPSETLPPSAKQVSYIRRLSRQSGIKVKRPPQTRARAARLIEELRPAALEKRRADRIERTASQPRNPVMHKFAKLNQRPVPAVDKKLAADIEASVARRLAQP